MAAITTSGGVLDVNSPEICVVLSERATQSAPITRREIAATTQISAVGSLKGALAAFKSALEPLRTTEAFQTRSAKVADAAFFSVTADDTAAAGHYDIEVVDLAQSHQLASNLFLAGSSTSVGHGDLSISLGTDSFTVSIPPGGATLAKIRDAINSAPGNTGVQATLLNSSGGARLILTGAQTGVGETIKVAASGGDGGLNQLVYDPLGVKALSQLRPAQDGKITIAGFDVTSSSNVFTDAVDGITITAKAETKEDASIGLDVAVDTTAISNRIQTFVAAYNGLQSTLTRLGGYNPATQVAGALLGDPLLRGIQNQARRDLSDPVAGLTGAYATLATVGITTTATGTLEVSTSKLNAAIAADPAAIARLFGSEDGVAARMYANAERRLATDGDINGRTQSLDKELKGVANDKAKMDLRLAQIGARFRKQFVALDGLLTKMQTTSSYLSQQLSSLPKIG